MNLPAADIRIFSSSSYQVAPKIQRPFHIHFPLATLPTPRLATTQGGVEKQYPETCHLQESGEALPGGHSPPHSGMDLPGLDEAQPVFPQLQAGRLLPSSLHTVGPRPSSCTHPAITLAPSGKWGALAPQTRAARPWQGRLHLALPTYLVNVAIKWFPHGFLRLLLIPQAAASALLTANGFSWQCSISNINNQRLIKTKGENTGGKNRLLCPFFIYHPSGMPWKMPTRVAQWLAP